MIQRVKPPDTAPDWGRLIDDLLRSPLADSEPNKLRAIAAAMGLSQMTESIIRSYRDGVQPMWWRGDALVRLWCEVMHKDRAAVPMIPVTRGRRRLIGRAPVDTSPQATSLPAQLWPAAAIRAKQRKVAA